MAFLTLKQAVQTLPSATTTKGSLLSAIEVDGNLLSLNADTQTRLLRAGDTMGGPLNWNGVPTIASAATVNLAAATSNSVIISGGVNITSLGTLPAGAERTLMFTGSPTITHSASLVLPYGTDIVAAAGESGKFISLGSGNWQCLTYSRDLIASGTVDQYRRGDKTWADFGTTARNVLLTGLSLVTSTAVASTDTIIIALGKLQKQITLKQDTLVSGTNLKTINGETLLGSTNIQVGKVPAATPSNGSRLTVNRQYHINGNTTSGFVFYLPAATQGQEIEFIDMYGNWNTGAWYVGYDVTGGKVMGLSENMLVDRANYNFTLVWTDATGGWRIK